MGPIQKWLARAKIISGEKAENLARAYLEKQGLHFIARNFRIFQGEIDLIMRHRSTLVFVEVRYRKRRDYVSPEQSISYAKRKRLIKTALFYLQNTEHIWYDEARFDVVAVGEHQEINWLINAFDLESHEQSF
jgi:putative endonuclease